ncbi:MAG: serine hydrolase domain-containing protein [Bacteroidota bacterium]|jgi:CubicO group peptidase (beta-lactamase class C family)
MMRKSLSLLLSMLLVVQLFGQPHHPTPLIDSMMKTKPVVGLSVAVVKHNRIIYTQSFGYKNLERSIPLTNDGMFRIASISKSFSATAIMQLQEQGKLSIDQDVSELIGFPVRNPRYPDSIITLRLMMSHLSSINDSQGYFTLDAIHPEKNTKWMDAYSNYPPGTKFSYCNMNYNMIGAIIERVSGERFDQYVYNHVLTPLKLSGGYNLDELDTSRLASIYEYRSDSGKFVLSPGAYASRTREVANYQLGYSAPLFSPTGGMKISASDLARYMIMHSRQGKNAGKRIISRKSARLMQTPLKSDTHYAFAIENSDKIIPGQMLWGHTGSAYGLHSAMFFQPDKKFGFVLISNGVVPGNTAGVNTFLRQVMLLLYEQLIAEKK